MIVLWRITERCNFGCSFCAYDRRLRQPRKDAVAAEVERFGRLIGEWSQATDEPVMLSWLGGEPLLWPPLLGLSDILRHDCGLAISATTNGSTLHRGEVRQGILDHFAELTVSVDGLAPRHDALRQSNGSWSKIAAGVQALAAGRKAGGQGLRLRANVVLMRASITDFPELCRVIADWGIDEITVNQLGGRDRPEFYPAHRLLPEEVAQLRGLLPGLCDELTTRNVRLCGNDAYLDRIAATALGQPLRVEDCGPGEHFLFINENCIISPCSFTTEIYGVPSAEILTIGDLAELPGRFRNSHATRRGTDCDDCPSTQVFSKFSA